MTYHMPRVMHWIQNKSVNFYATSEVRQITSPPLVEYMIMHVMLLTGSDKFVCMVQGMSYVLSAGLILLVDILLINDKFGKMIMIVITTILNYFCGKILFIN